jgi:hypothetical protein
MNISEILDLMDQRRKAKTEGNPVENLQTTA